MTQYAVGAGPGNTRCASGPETVSGSTSGSDDPSVLALSNCPIDAGIKQSKSETTRNERSMASA